MKEYKDNLLLEFLMFSKNIDKEIIEFSDSILEIDSNTVEQLVEGMEEQNIYTENNIENLKKVITYMKPKLGEYEDMMYTLLDVIPSNDVYYYEFMSKWNVLENEIGNSYSMVPKKIIEDSIRFDFYAFNALCSSSSNYIEKFLVGLIHNPLYLLFINKLMYELPDALLDKQIKQRIISVLKYNIETIEDENMILYHQKLLKKVEYLTKNKKATIFDFEHFEFCRNKAFVEYLITSGADFEDYHNFIISDKFITFLDNLTTPDDNEKFCYNTYMIERLKDLIKYILEYRQDNWYKLMNNILLSRIDNLKSIHETEFYREETRYKKSHLESFVVSNVGTIDMINDMKLSLQADYLILEGYSLPEENFKRILNSITMGYYMMWLRKMKKLNGDFFNNDFLRKRTIQILESFEKKEPNNKEVQKMKKKIMKINKELEY